MLVRLRRALEAFWRWEQTLARCTRDIVIAAERREVSQGWVYWRGGGY